MVVYSCLLCAGFDSLFDEVDEIGRPKFAKTGQGFCTSVDCQPNVIILDDPTAVVLAVSRRRLRYRERRTDSGIAGVTMAAHPQRVDSRGLAGQIACTSFTR